jgi:hypothetical protein
VIVGPEREIVIPPDSWHEYGFQVGGEAIYTPGSRRSGGFGLSTPALMAEAGEKMGGAALRQVGQGRFGDGHVIVPPEINVKPGDRLLTVRGSCFGLGFVARGPIYARAAKYTELEVFALS